MIHALIPKDDVSHTSCVCRSRVIVDASLYTFRGGSVRNKPAYICFVDVN
jgi:hypothetical protein